jgi:spermidine synthase
MRATCRLLPLAVASGACALVYQIAWTRDFRLVFGASTPASAAVVAVFVGGLGLGAWKLGARAERSPVPLRFYALLELGIALSAAASPLLVALATRAYVALGGSVVLGPNGATLARLLLTALVLAAPTFLMGGTLPALSRAAFADSEYRSRWPVGLLYGANTLGAVAGCLVANFVMIERFGTHASLWGAACVNLVLAAAAGLLALRSPPAPAPTTSMEEPAPRSERSVPAPAPFVLAAAAVVGFAFFLLELVFYRLLIPLLGGTVYTFGLVLAVALLGIGIGGALYGALYRRRQPDLRSFVRTCFLEAWALAVAYALGDRIALLALVVRPHDPSGLRSLLAGWFAVTALVLLPASIAAGVQFPMLIGLLGRGRRDVARHVGAAHAWNSVGAIAGAVAGGFGLMPLLTAPGCWRLAIEVLGVTAVVAAALDWRRERNRIRWATSLVVAAALMSCTVHATGPTAVWRHTSIGAGRKDGTTLKSTADVMSFVRNMRREVEWEADGIESSVALHSNLGYAFTVNGKVDGHCLYDAGTQVMGGLLGAMLHPGPRTAMVIGLGTGSTAGWLASVPGIDRVDVVELEPSMTEVARRCALVNQHALDNARLHLVLGDAREVLSVTRSRYDIIFSEPSNPYRAGVASLYTREYYRRALEHLSDDGLFLQWVQGYEIDRRTMRTIFATMASAFPYVEAWQLEEPDLVLVASRRPIVKDVGLLRARVAAEPFAQALRVTWGVEDAEGVLAHYVARPALAAAIVAEGADPLNTDDRPVVEFGFARMLNRHGEGNDAATVSAVRAWAHERGWDRPEVIGGDVDWDRFGLERAEIPCVYSDSAPYETPEDASEEVRQRLENEGDVVAADEGWAAHPRTPPTRIEIRHLAEDAVRKEDPEAEPRGGVRGRCYGCDGTFVKFSEDGGFLGSDGIKRRRRNAHVAKPIPTDAAQKAPMMIAAVELPTATSATASVSSLNVHDGSSRVTGSSGPGGPGPH